MREYLTKGAVVLAIAGREKNKIFLILNSDGEFAYIINGKSRTINNPKKKNKKHLHLLCKSELTHFDIESDKLTDAQVKKFLNNYNKSRVK